MTGIEASEVDDRAAGAEAFYTRVDGEYVPTGAGISPWNGRAQMGVALAGLAAYALDRAPFPAAMTTARLTIDILGAVPLEPLATRVIVLREGPRFQLLAVELAQGSRCWVRATALRVRDAVSPVVEEAPTRCLPDAGARAAAMAQGAFAAIVPVEGGFPHPGPGAWWIRPMTTVVADEPLRPIEAAAMVADFGSGVAPLVSPRDWTFANLDITVYLSRPPRGDWLLVDATSASGGNGVGLAHGRLGDRDGMIGHAHQTVFLDRR